MDEEPTELAALVETLGALSPEEIRKLMQEHGIKAGQGSWYCPLALFLKEQTGGDVRVGHMWIFNDRTGEHVETPESLIDFMIQYDVGRYPELMFEVIT